MTSQATAAEQRARRLYRSPAFQSAYVDGARAAFEGRPETACPYRSSTGWRAWRRAWIIGYHSVDAGDD